VIRKKVLLKIIVLLFIPIALVVPLYAMEMEEEAPQQSPTFNELKMQIAARSEDARKIMGYDLGMEVVANEYAGIKQDTPINHAAVYCYGAGQHKSDYTSRLIELHMPVILFKFSDDASKGITGKFKALRKMNLGQYADIKAMMYVFKASIDVGIKHLHPIGYSRGGAALINTIGALNSFDEDYNDLFQKFHIDFGKSKELIAKISSVILHCPLVDTRAAIKRTTQSLRDIAKNTITPSAIQRNEGIFSFYWNHTWPFYHWQSKDDATCGDSVENTILPAVSSYNPKEKQPIERIQEWPHNSFYVWLVLQKQDKVTPIESSRALVEEIYKTNQKEFYFIESESDLGHFDYWNEEKNGGLDAFFAKQGAPYDQDKIEKGGKILIQMKQPKIENPCNDEEEVKEED
jgi:hypothetical protein